MDSLNLTKQDIDNQTLKLWERSKEIKTINEQRGRVFFAIMALFSFSLNVSIWIEPTRGVIGQIASLDENLIFVVTQWLVMSCVIYGANAYSGKTNAFLWIVANGGIIFLCLTPFFYNATHLLTTCQVPEVRCPTTAWSNVVILAAFAFFLIFLATTIDLGNEQETIQDDALILSVKRIQLENNDETPVTVLEKAG